MIPDLTEEQIMLNSQFPYLIIPKSMSDLFYAVLNKIINNKPKTDDEFISTNYKDIDKDIHAKNLRKLCKITFRLQNIIKNTRNGDYMFVQHARHLRMACRIVKDATWILSVTDNLCEDWRDYVFEAFLKGVLFVYLKSNYARFDIFGDLRRVAKLYYGTAHEEKLSDLMTLPISNRKLAAYSYISSEPLRLPKPIINLDTIRYLGGAIKCPEAKASFSEFDCLYPCRIRFEIPMEVISVYII